MVAAIDAASCCIGSGLTQPTADANLAFEFPCERFFGTSSTVECVCVDACTVAYDDMHASRESPQVALL